MVLEVGLIAAVQTIVVKHSIHACIVGIVAGTNGIDIVALHQQNILQHVVGRNCTASYGVSVMTVHTLQDDTLAVDIKQRTDDLHLADTHLGGECHHILAALVLLHDVQSVESRSLGCPEAGIGNQELGLTTLECLFCNQLTLGSVQLGNRSYISVNAYIHNTVLTADIGLHHMVADTLLGYIIYIYATEDT